MGVSLDGWGLGCGRGLSGKGFIWLWGLQVDEQDHSEGKEDEAWGFGRGLDERDLSMWEGPAGGHTERNVPWPPQSAVEEGQLLHWG